MQDEVDTCTLFRLFGLEEDHIPAKEERVVKEETKNVLEGIDMLIAFLEMRESKRMGRYSQDMRQPVRITFKWSCIARRCLSRLRN